MKNKKVSFMDHLEYYFNVYLPTVKGLAQSTIVSYKATFRILMEFLYTVKGIPADMGYSTIQLCTNFEQNIFFLSESEICC